METRQLDYLWPVGYLTFEVSSVLARSGVRYRYSNALSSKPEGQ